MSALPQGRPNLRAVPKKDISIEVAENYPLVPDATYSALCTGYEAAQVFKGGFRLFFHFRLLDPGEHSGKILFAAYPVHGERVKQPGKRSWVRFKLHRRAWLYKMLVRVLNLQRTTKAHHVWPAELVNKVCRIQTATVVEDYEQQPLCPEDQYSKVKDVLSCEAG